MRQTSVLTAVMVALALAPVTAWAQAQTTPDPPGFNGRYGPVGKFYDEYKAGTLSADDYQKLVQMRDDMVGQVFDNMNKDRDRSGLTADSIKTTLSNVSGEFTDAVKSGDSQAVTDAVVSGNHQMTTQVLVPSSIQAGIVVDDLTDITIKLYKARGEMDGADPDAVNKQVNGLEMYKSAADANLYVMRQKLEAADATMQMDPVARQQLDDKVSQAMKDGDISVDENGNLNINAVLKKTGLTSADAGGNPVLPDTKPAASGDATLTEHYKLDADGNPVYEGADMTSGGQAVHADPGGKTSETSTAGGVSGEGQGGLADTLTDMTGGGSVAFESIYANYASTDNGNGDPTIAIPSTQVAGPSLAGTSPDTHPQGPSSTMNGPSSGGVQGPSSVMTGPSSGGVQGPSSTLTGPSSTMTGPSTQVTGPSSTLGGAANTPTGPQSGDNAYAVSNNDDGQPSLCGR